ncbi:hypothetical protein TNCV_1115971, partial [Trichonephila clavipes]
TLYFQCVPSNIGLNGNEIADSLAKSATADALHGDTCLTFAEIPSVKRIELNALWRIPSAYPWYFGGPLGITLIFLGISRRLYYAFLIATSNLLLFKRVRKSFQTVIGFYGDGVAKLHHLGLETTTTSIRRFLTYRPLSTILTRIKARTRGSIDHELMDNFLLP